MTAACSTTKKNFFISYLCYKLFRNKNLLIISALFSVLCIPLFSVCMSICIEMVNATIENQNFDTLHTTKMFGDIDMIMSAGFVIAVASAAVVLILAFVTVNSMFSYNLKKCDADMYLSLPLTTTQRFFSDLVTGGIVSVLPMAISGAISAVIMAVTGISADEGFTTTYLNALSSGDYESEINIAMQQIFSRTNNILYRELPQIITYVFIAMTVVLVFTYLFCVLINSFTGKMSDYIVYTIIAMAALSVIVTTIVGTAIMMVTEAASSEELSSAVMFASPAGMIFAFILSIVNSFGENVFAISESKGVYSAVRNDNIDIFCTFNTRNVIIMILVFAVLIVLAYVVTRLRKAEKTGSHFVFELPYHIISLSIVCALICIAIGTSPVMIDPTLHMTFMICIAISAIVYFFAEITHGRKINKLWQSLLRYVGAILGTLFLCTVIRQTDIFGLERYVPATDGIKSVEMSSKKAFSDNGNSDYYTIKFKNADNIGAITKYHSFIVNNGCAHRYSDYGVEPGNDNYSVRLVYKMKDGRTITRSLGIAVNQKTHGEYAKTLYDMRYVFSKTDEYAEEIKSVGAMAEKIDFYTRNGNSYGRLLNNDLNDKLISAIENDYKSGRNTGKLAAVVEIKAESDIGKSVSVEIREGCSETLAILNDETNSVSYKKALIDDAKKELENYRKNKENEYDDDGSYARNALSMYTIYDTDTNLDTYVLLNYSNIRVSSAKHTTVTCEFAESESVSELEKLFVMYDYYTDGLLADADYLIVDNSEFRDSFGGAYIAPHENSKRVADLIYSIRKEYNIPIEQ